MYHFRLDSIRSDRIPEQHHHDNVCGCVRNLELQRERSTLIRYSHIYMRVNIFYKKSFLLRVRGHFRSIFLFLTKTTKNFPNPQIFRFLEPKNEAIIPLTNDKRRPKVYS